MEYKVIFGIIGGLGLFIYGMHLLSDSLRKLSLGLLKTMLEKLTSNNVMSILVGLVATAIIQSSSATSVILIGFLNAGITQLGAALAIMVGANIGTTVTAQLIAFKFTTAAPLFVFLGAIVFFFAKKNKHKNKGLALLGFGLLFMGLSLMSSAVKPLAGNDAIRTAFMSFGDKPLLGILTGLIVTAILQSSSTTTGMIIAFALAGLLDLPSSIYLIFGTNIGTCVTAIIASFGGNLASKRLALGNTLFNIAGTVIAICMVPLYLRYIPLFSESVARQVANSHTVFNIVNTIIILPLIPFFVKLLERMIPGKDYKKQEIRYLDDNLLTTANLALSAVIKELTVMLSICQGMLEKAELCIVSYNHKLKNEITFDEESVDEMQKNITEYLVKIDKNDLPEREQRLIFAVLHSVNDIEKVADFCENIVTLSQRTFEENLKFSGNASEELERLFGKTKTLMKHTKRAVQSDDHKSAQITLTIDREINELIAQYKMNHIMRLEKGTCISESGLVFSDILTDIERINGHLCNITKGILHIGKR